MNDAMPNPAHRGWRWRRWLLFALAIYVGVFVLILTKETQFVFQPAKQDAFWWKEPSADVENIKLTTATGDTIHAWWFPKKYAKTAVLYSHGNGLNLSLWGKSMVKWRENLDSSVLIYDYPGYGQSTGVPSEAGCYAAAESAWQWLTNEKGIEPANVIFASDSLGGAMAVELATHHPHRALVLLKAFSSIPDMAGSVFPIFPGRYFVRNQFNNLAKIESCTRPLFLYHGERDALVPFSHGEQLFQRAKSVKEMYADPAGTHDTPLPADFFTRLKQFLTNHAPN